MSEDKKIDFSALALSRDQKRWEQTIGLITSRALERRRSRAVPLQLLAWARPALALAAVLALVAWAGPLLGRTPSLEQAEPAYLLSQWAVSGEPPATTQILEVFGGEHVTR